MDMLISQLELKKILQLGMMFLLKAIFLDHAYAQSDMGKTMSEREGMMNKGCTCPMMSGMMGEMGMHGIGGTIIMVLTVILLLAIIATLIAVTVYLIRKGRR